MTEELFVDVKLQISSSYATKRIMYNDYICNWSKPHIYKYGKYGEISLCGKHFYIIDGGCEVDLFAVRENPKLVCKKCYEKYIHKKHKSKQGD